MSRLGDPTPRQRHPLTPSAANARRVLRRRTTSQRRLQTVLLARRPERTCRKNSEAHSARSCQRNRRTRQPLPRRTAAPTAIGELAHSISQRTTRSNLSQPSPAVCLTNAFHPRQAAARALPAKRTAARVTLPGATPPEAASPACSQVRGGGAGRRVQTLVRHPPSIEPPSPSPRP